jgi:hypothetical protein
MFEMGKELNQLFKYYGINIGIFKIDGWAQKAMISINIDRRWVNSREFWERTFKSQVGLRVLEVGISHIHFRG